jgi:hypothetical protein
MDDEVVLGVNHPDLWRPTELAEYILTDVLYALQQIKTKCDPGRALDALERLADFLKCFGTGEYDGPATQVIDAQVLAEVRKNDRYRELLRQISIVLKTKPSPTRALEEAWRIDSILEAPQ